MFELVNKWFAEVTHTDVARFNLPPVVYEIAPGFVVGARLEGSGHQARKVRHVELARIKTEALNPHLSHANVADAEELGRATAGLISGVGNGGGRYGLIVPDGAARVAILSFETLPENWHEAEALVRWRMKDKVPYNSDEARMTFQELGREAGHIEVLAIAVRAPVLAEYEGALASTNGGAALILPATVALLPLLSDTDPRGQLLLHLCANWFTAVVVASGRPFVWRTRELDPANPQSHAPEVAAEAMRVLASARDRLQTDLGRIWLCARPPVGRDFASTVASAIGKDVELMTAKTELTSLLPADERAVFDQFGATVAGLVANIA